MFASTRVSLRQASTWDPAVLTAGAVEWPQTDWPLVPLGDVASTLSSSTWVEKGTPVITPGSLDAWGGVRRRSRSHVGSAYQIGTASEGARPGDLLVPSDPAGAVVFVGPELVGSLASSRFTVLRPTAGRELWIWGLLNSRTGKALRLQLAVGSSLMQLTRRGLLSLAVPMPPLERGRSVDRQLFDIQQQTTREEEEPRETWWRRVDLRGTEWRFALATPHPESLQDGTPLVAFCADIERGKAFPRKLVTEDAAEGAVAISDTRALSSGRPRRWARHGLAEMAFAESGDVLVAGVGVHAYATVADGVSVVDSNVLKIRLHEPHQAAALVRFLNGPRGYALRQIYVIGSVIPTLRTTDLGRFPIPDGALEAVLEEPGRVVPLDVQLEQVLWT